MLNNEPMLDLAFHRMVEDSVSSWMVGDSYLGITSGSPVIRERCDSGSDKPVGLGTRRETSMVISTAGRRGDPQCSALYECAWNGMYRTRRLFATNARYALKFADQDSGHRL
jgi:hypothetical protein